MQAIPKKHRFLSAHLCFLGIFYKFLYRLKKPKALNNSYLIKMQECYHKQICIKTN